MAVSKTYVSLNQQTNLKTKTDMKNQVLNIKQLVEETRSANAFLRVGETSYMKGSMAANYVAFVKDLFVGQYGAPTHAVIRKFGDSIQVSKDNFKKSYLERQHAIHEVADSVFIQTALNSKRITDIIKGITGELNLTCQVSNRTR